MFQAKGYKGGKHYKNFSGKENGKGKDQAKKGKFDNGKSKMGKGKESTEQRVPGTDGSLSGARCHHCKLLGHIRSVCPDASKKIGTVEAEMVAVMVSNITDAAGEAGFGVENGDAWLLALFLNSAGAEVITTSERGVKFFVLIDSETLVVKCQVILKDVQGKTSKQGGKVTVSVLLGDNGIPRTLTLKLQMYHLLCCRWAGWLARARCSCTDQTRLTWSTKASGSCW